MASESRDGEGLAWLRSPWAKDKNILLVHGDFVEVKSGFDSKNVKDVTLKDFEDYDIVVSSSPLYMSADAEFLEVNRLIDLLYKRFTWKRMIYTICREASNLLYSRLRISENQLLAKTSEIYLLREARHMGISWGLDTLKWTSIDLDIRSMVDYLILKSQGAMGLPDHLKFLYKYFEPWWVRDLKKGQFIILTKKGSLGAGIFSPLDWHKKMKENIIKSTGLEIEYLKLSEAKPDKDMGKFSHIGDATHAKIVSLYVEGLGYQKICDELNIASTRTPFVHVARHNRNIKTVGYCDSCRRAGGEYAEKTA